MKFAHQNFLGNQSHIGPETESLYCFHRRMLKFEQKNCQYALIGATEERQYRVT